MAVWLSPISFIAQKTLAFIIFQRHLYLPLPPQVWTSQEASLKINGSEKLPILAASTGNFMVACTPFFQRLQFTLFTHVQFTLLWTRTVHYHLAKTCKVRGGAVYGSLLDLDTWETVAPDIDAQPWRMLLLPPSCLMMRDVVGHW